MPYSISLIYGGGKKHNFYTCTNEKQARLDAIRVLDYNHFNPPYIKKDSCVYIVDAKNTDSLEGIKGVAFPERGFKGYVYTTDGIAFYRILADGSLSNSPVKPKW